MKGGFYVGRFASVGWQVRDVMKDRITGEVKEVTRYYNLDCIACYEPICLAE